MAIKTDMEKAYDRVEWNFVLKVMEKLGFHGKWIGWIEQCIKTPCLSILLNGSPYGKFYPSRGLHQGDPLSPSLFILCLEVFSRLLLREEARGSLRGLKLCRGAPVVTHLFADDLLLFARATLQDAKRIEECLDKYMPWSGQKINFSKSSIHFSKNFQGPAMLQIMDQLHLKKLPAKAKHSGLPLLIPRSKAKALDEVKSRLLKKMEGWKAKVLSQAGRATMITAVGIALPSSPMSYFSLPKTWNSEIDRMIKNFWWGYNQEKTRNLYLLWLGKICVCLVKKAGWVLDLCGILMMLWFQRLAGKC